MGDQTPHLTYSLRVVLGPKALLFWASLFFVLSAVNGLDGVPVYWGDAAVLALSAVLVWLGREWSCAVAAPLTLATVCQLTFPLPFESVEHWLTRLASLPALNSGFIALSWVVFCCAADRIILLSVRKRAELK